MGLLDDAIREHIELKRRAGTDQAEIARLESEAFGTGRRSGTAEAEPPGDHEALTATHLQLADEDPVGATYDDSPRSAQLRRIVTVLHQSMYVRRRCSAIFPPMPLGRNHCELDDAVPR